MCAFSLKIFLLLSAAIAQSDDLEALQIKGSLILDRAYSINWSLSFLGLQAFDANQRRRRQLRALANNGARTERRTKRCLSGAQSARGKRRVFELIIVFSICRESETLEAPLKSYSLSPDRRLAASRKMERIVELHLVHFADSAYLLIEKRRFCAFERGRRSSSILFLQIRQRGLPYFDRFVLGRRTEPSEHASKARVRRLFVASRRSSFRAPDVPLAPLRDLRR